MIGWLLCLPALLVIGLGFLWPTAILLRMSLNRTDDIGSMQPDLTFATYQRLLDDDMTPGLAMDTLLLAATQLIRISIGTVTQADKIQYVQHSALNLAPRCFYYLHSKSYVFINSTVRKQTVILENYAQLTPHIGNLIRCQR